MSFTPTNTDFRDLTNRVFGRLRVVRFNGRKASRSFWQCQCHCGEQVTVRADTLLDGNTRSCGCLRKSVVARMNTTHNKSRTTEYRSYQLAKNRCNNPQAEGYVNYGGRGIEFKFETFIDFYNEIGDKPVPTHLYSIDRIDNNGHYEPGNVRWSTRQQQLRNRRNTVLVEYQNKSLTVPEWAKVYSIPSWTIRRRLLSQRYCTECCLTTRPVKGRIMRCSHKKEKTQ